MLQIVSTSKTNLPKKSGTTIRFHLKMDQRMVPQCERHLIKRPFCHRLWTKHNHRSTHL